MTENKPIDLNEFSKKFFEDLNNLCFKVEVINGKKEKEKEKEKDKIDYEETFNKETKTNSKSTWDFYKKGDCGEFAKHLCKAFEVGDFNNRTRLLLAFPLLFTNKNCVKQYLNETILSMFDEKGLNQNEN